MKHIEDIIENELRNIVDNNQRSILRESNEDFYSLFFDKLKSKLENIDRMVVSELGEKESFPIFTILIHKDTIEEFSDELKPMLEPIADYELVDNEILVERVIVTLPHNRLNELNGKKFKGIKRSDNETKEFEFELRQNKELIKKEEELWSAFRINGVNFEPLFMPYNKRVFDLYAINIDESFLAKSEKGVSYELNFGEYRDFCFKDYQLMWNIVEKTILSDKLRIDQNDDGTYQHVLEEARQGLILVSPKKNENFIDIKIGLENKIFITTKLKIIKDWKLLILQDVGNIKRYDGFKFNIYHNSHRHSIINNLKDKYKNRMRTESEIFRLINSLECFKEIELVEVKLNRYISERIETFNTNEYITNAFEEEDRDLLCLVLDYSDNIEYKEEKLSYLISLIQNSFPEYEVIGKKVSHYE